MKNFQETDSLPRHCFRESFQRADNLKTESRRRGISASLLLLVAALLTASSLTGCAGSPTPPAVGFDVQVEQSGDADLLRIRRVWLQPVVFAGRGAGLSDSVQQRLNKTAARVSGESLDFEFLPSRDELGSSDGVLIIRVSEFQTSSGSRLGAERPAKVAFWVELQREGTVWRGSFSHSERELSENLLNLRNGRPLRWDDAFSLFEAGLRQTLGQLRQNRQARFLNQQN